jgi:DNA uptake protein ComE-like DNA-binding protein
MMAKQRPGFVLLAALWLLVAISAASLHAGARASDRRAVAQNVADAIALRAVAASALSYVIAMLEEAVVEQRAVGGPYDADPWQRASELIGDSIPVAHGWATVGARDPGTALNLNLASTAELTRLLSALGVEAGRTAAITGALLASEGRAFADATDLWNVPGMDPDLFELLSAHLTLVGDGRINLNAAPRPVLLTLPGFTEEAVAAVYRRRASGKPYETVFEIVGEVGTHARSQLEQHFMELAVRTRMVSTAVEVDIIAGRVGSRASHRLEALLVRAGDRVDVVWRRER